MLGMRAASLGVPFHPVPGLVGSDLPQEAGLKMVKDPYSGAEVYCVPAIRPQWAVLHVQEADARGNARIYGSSGYDVLMAEAADNVILTVERLVPTQELERLPELTSIPEFRVAAVVLAQGGAAPASCYPYYDIDEAAVEAYLVASASPEGLRQYLYSVDRELQAAAPS